MSLRDIAQKSLAGFDAKKDSVSAPQGLPAGEYTMIVTKIDHRVFDSGWDAFGITFEVVEGDETGRHENVNISFAETSKSGKPIPDFVLDRNIKFASKLGALLGVDITSDDFAFDSETDIHEHLAQKMHGQEGKLVKLEIIESPNKKDPSHPYRNYDLKEAEQPETIDVKDDDLPY
ncbi:hypothetical protein IV38_GL001946 [Lactobacillus selangorensis]|uniref:DUF669 domain-containing protein n=1 Tax=Lactobacillus selangorensis TaxID=81857 RepID=A0A0R2FST0_9LACO|nr:hypothetical protein [Lactobacillus selangorensis]KRN27732.1 hypothetical protein IV38_GL001946 [Lactobacillus selangorensis]KRN30303.1 hypothetical protein IV40_GL001891 [Lactobacillus selangorensis]